jgi:polyphosphate kinase
MTTAIPKPREDHTERQLRWLDVASGILDLTRDDRLPVRERVRLSAIFVGLVDEFFAISAAMLTRPWGAEPTELSTWVHELVERYDGVVHDDLAPAMVHEGLLVVRWDQVTDVERADLDSMFRRWIEPVLTPLTVDATHPFPYVSALSLNLAVLLRDPNSGGERFAQVTVPPLVSPLLTLEPTRLVPLHELVAGHLGEIFAGSRVVAVRSEHNTAPQVAKTDMRSRRFGTPVRLEVDQAMPPAMLALLLRELDLTDADVYRLRSPLAMGDCLSPVIDLDDISSIGTGSAARAATRPGPTNGAARRSARSTSQARAVS